MQNSTSKYFRAVVTGQKLSTQFTDTCKDNKLFGSVPLTSEKFSLVQQACLPLSNNQNLSFSLTPYMHDNLSNISSHRVLGPIHLLIITVDLSEMHTDLEKTLALDFIMNRAKAKITNVVIAGVITDPAEKSPISATKTELQRLAEKYGMTYYDINLKNPENLTSLFCTEISKHHFELGTAVKSASRASNLVI